MADNESSHLMWIIIVVAIAALIFMGLKVAFPGLISDVTDKMTQGVKGIDIGGDNVERPDENDAKWTVKANYGTNGRFVMDKDGNAAVYAIDVSKPIELTSIPDITKDNDGIKNLTYLNKVLASGSMSKLFYHDSSISSIKGLDKFDTSKVTDMSYMFCGMTSLKYIDLSNFDTSNTTSMRSMFFGDSQLESLKLSNFNTKNVKSMYGMFSKNTMLKTLDVSMFDTSNVSTMEAMFSDTTSLTSLNVSNFDTSKVTSMSAMFQSMLSLKSLDVSNFDTSNVVDFSYMFTQQKSLNHLNLSNFNMSKASKVTSMINGETQLTKDSLILTNVVKVTDSTLYSQVPFLFDNDHQYLNVMLHESFF